MKMGKGPDALPTKPTKPASMAVKLPMPEDEQRQLARKQGDYYMALAKKVENGESLDSYDTLRVIAALKFAAEDRYSFTPTRSPGRAPKVCHAFMALEYGCLIGEGLSSDAACAELAEKNDISKEAVKKSLKKQGCYRPTTK